MILMLILTGGFVAALTLAAVYSAMILAHRTDEIVSGMRDDSTIGAGPLPAPM